MLPVLEMEEQKALFILGNVVHCPLENIVVDMPVRVIFEDINDNLTLFYFEPL